MNYIKQVLNNYRRIYGKFTVAIKLGNKSYKYWKHFTYPSQEYDDFFLNDSDEAEHRIIFNDEIVIESDHSNRKLLKKYSYRLVNKLIKHNFEFEMYHSGNKSYHIHIFFEFLNTITGDDDRRLLKELFIKWLVGCPCQSWYYSTCTAGLNCPIKKMDIDMQKTGKTMIRMEYAEHEKTGKLKTPIVENITDDINEFPIEIIKKYHSIKRNKGKYIPTKPIEGVKMNCINFYLENTFTDMRKRIEFFLTANVNDPEPLMNWAKINNIRAGNMAYKIRYRNRQSKKPKCTYSKGLLKDMNRLDVCNGCPYTDELYRRRVAAKFKGKKLPYQIKEVKKDGEEKTTRKEEKDKGTKTS
jgi:hypothetical protein